MIANYFCSIAFKYFIMEKENLRDIMYDHYLRWKSGNQTQVAYSSENGLTIDQFHYWVKKFRSADEQSVSSSGNFVPLVVDPVSSKTPLVEIQHRNGHCIRFFTTVDVSILKSLL